MHWTWSKLNSFMDQLCKPCSSSHIWVVAMKCWEVVKGKLFRSIFRLSSLSPKHAELGTLILFKLFLYVCKYVWSLKSEVNRYVFMNNKCTSKYMLYYSTYENIEWVVWTGMNSSIAASRVDSFLSSYKLFEWVFLEIKWGSFAGLNSSRGRYPTIIK